jgi:hypothetical protein
MYLKCHPRIKDGKEHRYWSVVENRRCGRGKFVQRQVLYLGEINDSQRESWCRMIEVFDEKRERTLPLALFPADRQLPNFAAGFGVRVRLKEMELHRPRQWGACWLACYLYEQLELDEFWTECLADSREGTCWQHILQTLVCYGLIDPGSEWRLHRQWFEQSAMGDLLDEDFALVEKNALYRCLDKVLKHKEELFGHLRQRWQDLFGARFEVLLYDLTSTYFESDPPFEETDKRQFGYSRDKRPDCVQVVIGLIITPEGFPLAYEVLPGNTSDKTTLGKLRRRHETEFYARQASILLGNNACRSGNDRSPTLKVFFALSRGRRGTQRALNSVSCLLLSYPRLACERIRVGDVNRNGRRAGSPEANFPTVAFRNSLEGSQRDSAGGGSKRPIRRYFAKGGGG